jgi:hypothetical protein
MMATLPLMDQQIHDTWWRDEFSPLKQGGFGGYVSTNGRIVIEVQRAPQGARGLYSGMMQLALLAADRPEVDTACLVLIVSRLSMDRLRREWMRIKSLFQPTISCRLSLVAIGKDDTWVEPDEEILRRIATVFQAARDNAPNAASPVGNQKQQEVLKLLIRRWLLREGPTPIGKLAEQVGCAYPTVREALETLEQHRDIVRNTNRSVELVRFPTRSWSELLALSGRLRRTFRYQDVSGERPDPERLLKRLERLTPPRVALGGVAAARHWHPDFDLHGAPRLDLVVHVPGREMDLHFVKKLDPALKQVEDYGQSPALVVRLLQRANPFFEQASGSALPFADPVETALDLCDLGLTSQASRLLSHLRPEIRLP